MPPAKLILAVPVGTRHGRVQRLYATLAFGSALALFIYPHSMTGILSASSGHAIRRNAAISARLFASCLGFLALIGFMAIAAGVEKCRITARRLHDVPGNFAVPALSLDSFPSWFVGFAFAAIGIGALVPAAIMSIAAANLFTRNIYREFINPNCTSEGGSADGEAASLIVEARRADFHHPLPQQYAIYLQLLGGIWIIQTVPSVLLGLYTLVR